MTYDKTQALEAMYELKKQGYTDITVKLYDNLMLLCNPGWSNEPPALDIDDIESWANHGDCEHNHEKDSYWHEGLNRTWEYWWIFD